MSVRHCRSGLPLAFLLSAAPLAAQSTLALDAVKAEALHSPSAFHLLEELTDANAADIVSFFGMKATKLGIMDFNIGHTMEHYGNLVTYMRLKNIVPPSSEPRPPAGKKKSGE